MPFNEACHQLQVHQKALIHIFHRCRLVPITAAAIELLLFKFPLGRLIVGGAPFLGGLFTAGLATSKRTINIVTPSIAGMG
jgi:hypothetical protein